jgi:hypothetical protein
MKLCILQLNLQKIMNKFNKLRSLNLLIPEFIIIIKKKRYCCVENNF